MKTLSEHNRQKKTIRGELAGVKCDECQEEMVAYGPIAMVGGHRGRGVTCPACWEDGWMILEGVDE